MGLQLFFVLSALMIYSVSSDGPPPPPPPPPEAPPPIPQEGGGCEPDYTCESTFTQEKCTLSLKFQSCAEAANASCSGNPVSAITEIIDRAKAKVAENCQGTSGSAQAPSSGGGGACQPDYTCEPTFIQDICTAAQAYRVCAETAAAACNGDPGSIIKTFIDHANLQVSSDCGVAPPTLPGCASSCVSYEEQAIGNWAVGKHVEGCAQYDQYRTCLINHDNTGACPVTEFIVKANTKYNDQCTSQ